MKTVRIVAAVICDSLQEKKQIFSTEDTESSRVSGSSQVERLKRVKHHSRPL